MDRKMERTFVAVKPDAVQRGLIGEVIKRFERKGFKIIGLKMMQLDEATAKRHYAEHVGKPFFDNLIDFITSGPIVAMVLKGIDVIEQSRHLMGVTDPRKAAAGTIRGDYAQITERNIVHGSDSVASAEREIGIFFKESELTTAWHRDTRKWISQPKLEENV